MGNCFEVLVFTVKQVIMVCDRTKERYSQTESHLANKRDWKYSHVELKIFITISFEFYYFAMWERKYKLAFSFTDLLCYTLAAFQFTDFYHTLKVCTSLVMGKVVFKILRPY